MLSSKLESAQQNIRQRWDPHFRWVINETAPWAPLVKPLAQATIALVTTCGIFRSDMQLPFDAWHNLGDPSFREIHIDTPQDCLRIAHSHFDHIHLASDINVALPMAHFTQLVSEGAVGRLYSWAHSFMGYLPEPLQLVTETAPTVARRLRADGVDAVFLTPC